MANGEWRMANGEWRMANGEWRMANGEEKRNSGRSVGQALNSLNLFSLFLSNHSSLATHHFLNARPPGMGYFYESHQPEFTMSPQPRPISTSRLACAVGACSGAVGACLGLSATLFLSDRLPLSLAAPLGATLAGAGLGLAAWDRLFGKPKPAPPAPDVMAPPPDDPFPPLLALARELPCGCVLSDAHGCFRYVNAPAERIFGYGNAELAGRPMGEVLGHFGVPPLTAATGAVPREDGTRLGEHRTRDGRPIACEWHTTPLRNRDGQVVGFFALVTDITESRTIQQDIRRRETYLRALLDNMPLFMWMKDAAGRYLVANEEFVRVGRVPRSETMVGKTDFDLYAPELAERFIAADRQAIGTGKQIALEERVFVRGEEREFETVKTPVFDTDGQLLGTVGFARDITALKRAEQTMREAATVFEASTEGIAITDAAGVIKNVNPAFTAITGYSAAEAIGQTFELLKSGRHDARFYAEFWRTIREAGRWEGEIWNRRKNGEIYPQWQTLSVVHDGKGRVVEYIVLFSDITDRKRAEEEIRHRANHDPLTELPNRNLLTERLSQAIKQAHRTGTRFAVLFLDLDHFKEVNDSLGHALGDRLLQDAAGRLNRCVRESDTVARQGGDEFVVLLLDIRELPDVATVAEKIVTTLALPFDLEGHEAHVTASVGVTLFPDDGEDVETLFRNADLAMYRAKATGRNNVQFFERAMTDSARIHRQLIADLRAAVRQNEFALHYQPIFDLAQGRPLAVEALLRWRHPRDGWRGPAEFIPAAEEIGLIRDIGEKVLDQACRQLAAWRAAGLPLNLTVNISGRQIPDALSAGFLNTTLDRHGLSPAHVTLEITEGLLLANSPETHGWMHAMRGLGCRVALDDFGAGYSCLTCLKHFPLDLIKIEKAFVRELATDPSSQALVKAILTMGQSLDLIVVAEGIEAAGQMDRFRQLGGRYAQGFLLCPPVPAEALPAALDRALSQLRPDAAEPA
jgi:diguanylate cyclase (GGDEF)-like protein/PAS domain S-box-containing protein